MKMKTQDILNIEDYSKYSPSIRHAHTNIRRLTHSIPPAASEIEREVQLVHLPVFVSSPLLSSANEGDFNY